VNIGIRTFATETIKHSSTQKGNLWEIRIIFVCKF